MQAQALIVMMLIMMALGSGQYEIWGTPYDMAYVQKESIAIEDGIEYYAENEKLIQNDFIGSFEQADTVALTNLIWEKSLGSPRKVLMEDDLSLELGDIIQLPDGRKILITNMSKDVTRGTLSILNIDGFKIMAPKTVVT